MNFRVKLIAIFCVVITVIACQKEEFIPSSSNSFDQTVTEVFTDGGPLVNPVGEPELEPFFGEDEERTDSWVVTEPAWPTGPQLEPVLDEELHHKEGFVAWPNDEDQLEPSIEDAWENVTIEWTDTPPTGDGWIMAETLAEGRRAIDIPRPGTDPCLYEDCATAIPAAIAHYQALANQLCQNMYFCVPCCSGGHILYAMVMVEHDCGIVPPPSEY